MNMERKMTNKKRILYLCTGNSCRSQMAEAWTRHLKKDHFEPYSAGVKARAVDPRAIKAMKEVGIDISGQQSKDIDTLANLEFDFVITLCDEARESCPFFPARTRLVHWGFDDPPRLAENAKGEEEAMKHYRRVRDEIRAFVEKLEEALTQGSERDESPVS
jgi:arsenate reductase